MDKMVLPGGHFDPGVWNREQHQFVGTPFAKAKCDPNLQFTAAREAREETGYDSHHLDWKFFMLLDRPDRDPRPDVRRVSVAYWRDMAELPPKLKAADDMAEVMVVNLMDIKPDEMGFDHFRVIDSLQFMWIEWSQTWEASQGSFIHHCEAMKNPTTLPAIKWIMMLDDGPHIVLNNLREPSIVPGVVKACPFCGADLTLPTP